MIENKKEIDVLHRSLVTMIRKVEDIESDIAQLKRDRANYDKDIELTARKIKKLEEE